MKKLLLLFAGALTLTTVSPQATARSETALASYSRPADRACFQESWGTMLNTCSTTRQLFIPAAIDKHCISGASFTVTAQSSSSSSNVCCWMIGLSSGGGISRGSPQCLPSFGAEQKFTVTGAALWQDRLFYVCDVGPNAKLVGIDWSPAGGC